MAVYSRILHRGEPRYVEHLSSGLRLLAAAPWESADAEISMPPLARERLTFLPPVSPSKIIAFGRNYRDHAAEMGAEVPESPLLFLKAPSCLLAGGDDVPLPPESERVECEGELALIIGRRLRRFPEDGAVDEVVGGWLVADDVTARDLQRSEGQWARAKSFDGFCPTATSFSSTPPEAGARLVTKLNGETCQDAALADMIFPLGRLLAHASAAMTLEPGDLVLTGTPAGVKTLSPGDRVEVEVTGLPALEHGVVAEGDEDE
ncbi:MAG: fumarylacetoacetate hydrolase family protein [Acidobacteriota bacterium]